LTLIPFDHRLVNWAQLSDADRTWLAWYHRQVWETIGPMLSGADRDWLWNACKPFFTEGEQYENSRILGDR
jgi:Xaa-Pro aminopeptidase